MKLRRRRQSEVPPKIKSFISGVIAVSFESIEEPLKSFFWDFDKGDFYYWLDLFNHFDTYFEKYIKPRKDLQIEDDFLESDPPFPREAVLQILRVVRIILENCTNTHFYSSYEHHISSLLASTDADVVEACLQTLSAFLRKSIGKHVIRDASLNSKLFAFAQGWGGKDEGLGLVACALESVSDPVAHELGNTLHFEFYEVNDLLEEEKSTQGLQIIHLPKINTYGMSDLELLHKIYEEYKVPRKLRFSLLTRLRFSRAFSSFAARQQYTCIRLHAFIVIVQACGDTDDLVSFFNTEPEFFNELVTLLSYEDAVSEKIRILSLYSLVTLSQDRSRQPTVLSAVTSGGHRGILSSLMQKAIDSVVSKSSKSSVLFAEALLSLVTVLVSSSSGCSAMREAGFIPTLLPLLKNTDPQHLHLVSTAVHVLEAFMDYSNPAAALFRDLGGLDDTISRLKVEVSYVENGSKQEATTFVEMDGSDQPLYSEALVSYHRRSLMKALLRAISLGTYAPGTTARVYGSEESLLPHCLHTIFKKAKDFGGGMFSLAAVVMSDLIHKDPTCYSILEEANLPSAFLDAIIDGVLCSAEAITCIPQCLDALCLNNSGLQAVKDRNALRCFVKIFTSRSYLRALMSDTPSSLSSGLDELMRHASSLRVHGVDMLIEILKAIEKIGSGPEVASSTTEASSTSSVPMETDGESSKTENPEKQPEASSDTPLLNVESFLPDCVNNVARLLETILQNSDTCRLFVEKKGIEAVLQLFTLPLMPSSVSIGQSVSIAFKNFSPHHSAYLARALCLFLREHLKVTNELLVSLEGVQIVQVVDESKKTKVLRCLSSLEGILSLSNSLSRGTTNIMSELGTSDADVLRDLGVAFREILWQVSRVDEKQSTENVNADTEISASNTVERESDDDASLPVVRYMNPLSVRNSSHPHWGLERDFVSVVRSGEGFSRRNRHGLARIRGGRTSRHLEALHIDPEASMSNTDISSPQDIKKKSPEVAVMESLNKLASTIRSFFTTLVKGFPSSNRRRAETGSLSTASKNIGTALARIFFEALSFPGHTTGSGLDSLLPVKCHYLGKVVDHMATLAFDNKRRICHTVMINNFYVQGTFKELLNTFEATSQLLWTLPFSTSSSTSGVGNENSEGSKLFHSKWLLDTLQSYGRLLECFVNSTFLLSPTSTSQAQLLVQPVAVGLSIGLFPVPRDPEVFVRMLQSQVLDVILPVWNHPMFPSCNPGFVTLVVSLVTHIYSGVGDAKRTRSGDSGGANQRFMPPPPDEATISTIAEMGFTRARAVEALRRVETNSVEMAMEWLFTHAEDPVQEDDELARALALSLGNSSETPKVDNTEKSTDDQTEVAEAKTPTPPIDDILAAAMKLFQSSDTMAFPLTDLLVTFCNRNKGEDRPQVISYLIQQLKLCPLDTSKETSTLCMISHTLALLLAEDVTAREMAVTNGIVSMSIDILMNFLAGTEAQNELVVPKCISALLLILDNLLQSRPKISSDSKETDTKQEQEGIEEKSTLVDVDKEKGSAFEKIFGKSTGYLTVEEGNRVLTVACDLIKRHVPAIVMQAVLLLCARLTKTHSLALQFLENGGMIDLFSIPKTCFFPGYDTLASAIIRHLIEDPQTLQTAMELEVRQALSGSRHAGRVPPRVFLTSMAPLISRDPEVFMKAAASVCQLETTGGRTVIVLSKDKEKEKEKDKAKALGIDIGESKSQETPTKCGKAQKKIPANLTQVVDHLLEIVMKYPYSLNPEEDCNKSDTAMEVDGSAGNKGKTKVDDTRKEIDNVSERSAELVKVTFVLKLFSDILLMYVHAVGIILKRDVEMHGGIVHHVMHRLLQPSIEKTSGSDEWRGKLSEKASWFLVVLCGRSSEGRRRVINALAKSLSSFVNSASSSSNNSLLPDKRVLAFVDLVHSILSKNSSSSNVPGSGCSPDIAKGMIDGGMIPCLSGILQVLDLDHPDAPKVVNIILKSLEGLTRAANAVEQLALSDLASKKKFVSLGTGSDNQMVNAPVNQVPEGTRENSQHEITGTDDAEQHHEETTQDEGDHQSNINQPAEQELRIEMNETENVGFMHEEMEDGGVLRDSDQIEMTFHVESRGGDNTGDEDDEMGDDGDDDEDDDDGDDEDEDIAEDGTALMSLADTDVEDHDETGLGDDYTDDMVDEEDDDYHENRVIEVRWREALGGVLGQPGADNGLIDITAEPFEGVNVDDLFGLRRPIGFDRRRQQSRTSFERSGTEGNGLQHPLLSRPSQSGESALLWSAGGGNSSRDLDLLSGGSFDVAHFYMFDGPVLPFDHVQSSVFGDRVGSVAPPPMSDFSVGLESLRAPTRRGPGDGRWTDNGQPQAGRQAAAIAQAVEEHFMSQLSTTSPHNSGLANDNQQVAEGVDNVPYQSENDQNNQELNQMVENVEQTVEGQAQAPTLDIENNIPDNRDNMEIGERNGNVIEQQDLSATDDMASNHPLVNADNSIIIGNTDVDMNIADSEANQEGDPLPSVGVIEESLSEPNTHIAQDDGQTGQSDATTVAPSENGIDPTFLEALPAELRAEVLASQQTRSAPTPVPAPAPATFDDIDPEFLAALPPDIQAEVLAQQRAQRVANQAEGQPVDMDNASIIATFPADLREEVLLTSSEAVLSALPSPLLAEAQMLRDRAMSHYQARSLFGNSHRLNNRRNGLGFDRQTVIDRGVGVTIGRRASSALLESLKVKEVEGDPLLDPDALKALIRLLRLAQPLGKGLLQRLFLNLCAHSCTRAVLVFLLLDMIKMESEGPVGGLTTVNSQRLYGCQSNVVYGRSQLLDGLPPLVLRRVLEILKYLATNHSSVANLLFYFDSSLVLESLNLKCHNRKNNKGKEKAVEGGEISRPIGSEGDDIPILLFVKLLNQPLFVPSIAHLEQVMGLLQVVVYTAASKLDSQSHTEQAATSSQGPLGNESASQPQGDSSSSGAAPSQDDKSDGDRLSTSDDQKTVNMFDIFMKLPQTDLHNLCSLLGHEGLSDKVYLLTGEVLKKLASVAPLHRKFFIAELSDLAHSLSSSAIRELITLKDTHMLGLSTGSMAGAAVLRILQTLISLTVPNTDGIKTEKNDDNQEHVTMWKLNHSLEPLWQELSECISVTETQLTQSSFSSVMSNADEHVQGAGVGVGVGPGASSLSPPLPPGTQRLLPFIESFLVLCEKLQANSCILQQDDAYATAREVKEYSGNSSPSGAGIDGAVTFAKFAEKHRRLLNAFVRQNLGLLEKSLSMMLKAPRLIDFDNKRSYFRSRIRQQHDQHLTGPLRISVRRAYVLEDSYNQLRMRPTQDLKGRLNVHFQGEEGIDAGGLTREWYQLLSRVIFDKGALLFSTGGNNATFQPNPNSVYQTEHLSYFKFVGRVVAKALFDGQLLDVYFTRSFYKHILGVKVTYHDIEAVDPDYYKNLKWLLENDVSDILDLTFSMDADEEKHILYEKTEVTDYELKPGGRNIRVTEETKHEYVDLVAEHILTNAIRPQINSFLEGFNELIPRDLISIFNDKELELLISGLPEIDLDDLKANAEYTGYTVGSSVVMWFWEVVKAFNKEDRARLLQFVTGTSKVPLEGFKALQGISGPQRFQIHKAYGAPERLPSAHTCFNQLDLPEYVSKEQLQERLLLAIHEASEGFGFG